MITVCVMVSDRGEDKGTQREGPHPAWAKGGGEGSKSWERGA